jgi:hypothetical protein
VAIGGSGRARVEFSGKSSQLLYSSEKFANEVLAVALALAAWRTVVNPFSYA